MNIKGDIVTNIRDYNQVELNIRVTGKPWDPCFRRDDKQRL